MMNRLFKNELLTLLTQEQTHESFFENEVHGLRLSRSSRKKHVNI